MKAGKPKDQGAKAAPEKDGGAFAALPADADLSNVVPLRRRPAAGARQSPALSIPPADRPAPLWAEPAQRRHLALFVGCSLLLHAALVFAFNREPVPLASLGEISISVDVVLGADAAAGLAQSPSESEAADAADAASPAQPDMTPPAAEIAAAPPQLSPAAPDIAADAKPAENPLVTAMRERPRTSDPRKPAPAAKRSEREAASAAAAPTPIRITAGWWRRTSRATSNFPPTRADAASKAARS